MRLLLALLCALVSLSLASASVAHAVESNVCIEQVADHADDAPADGDRDGGVDDHVNCHGHQLASLPADPARGAHRRAAAVPAPTCGWPLRAAASDPALRPPQA